jgi:uncharacterized protein (TIGR02246 family)
MSNSRSHSSLFACILAAVIGAAYWIGFASPPVISAGPERTTPKDEIRDLEGLLNNAVVKGDVELFNDLLADDFTHTSHNGKYRSRAEWLKGKVQGKSSYTAYDVEALSIRVLGDTAIVTAVAEPQWTETDGQSNSGQFRYIRIWAKRDGTWRAVAFQSTEVAADGATNPQSN